MSEVVWGDPLSCRYSWIEPGDLASYADVVRHVARKVGAAAIGLQSVAAIPESAFAGATAEATRSHAGRRTHDATSLKASLREVAGAIHAHADMLGRYREALDGLLQLASRQGLEVRDGRIWPPAAAPPPSPTQQYDAWITAWKCYRTCFDLKTEIEAERRERSLELVRAVTTHTGAQPEPPHEGRQPGSHGAVDFGRGHGEGGDDSRRRAAERARRALETHERLESTQEQVARLRQAHRAALAELQQLGRTGATEAQLTAQAREVRLAAETLRAERSEATRLQRELAELIS